MKELTCTECGEPVTLHRRDKTKTLRAGCACDGTAVKVAYRLPEGWTDE